jgi:cytochrome bd-type quinol oxidase subunit 2
MDEQFDERLYKLIKVALIVLTVISGAATLWFYIHRITFDEPLMFIAEILFNLPLIFSAMMFLFLLPVTIAWTLRKKRRHDERTCPQKRRMLS